MTWQRVRDHQWTRPDLPDVAVVEMATGEYFVASADARGFGWQLDPTACPTLVQAQRRAEAMCTVTAPKGRLALLRARLDARRDDRPRRIPRAAVSALR